MQRRCQARALRHRNVTFAPPQSRRPGVPDAGRDAKSPSVSVRSGSGEVAPPDTNATPVPGAGVAAHRRDGGVTACRGRAKAPWYRGAMPPDAVDALSESLRE